MCPPKHLAHDSKLLADNWATAHRMMNPHCPGINVYACGDHWHIGHASREQKDMCLANNVGYSHRGWKVS